MQVITDGVCISLEIVNGACVIEGVVYLKMDLIKEMQNVYIAETC